MKIKGLLLGFAVVISVPLVAFAQDATPEATPDGMMMDATAEATMMAMGEMAMMGEDVLELCPAPANLPETVTIGAVFGLSGSTAVYGIPQQDAVQLAVDEINAMGFLGEGTTLAVSFADAASDNEGAINAMTQLVEEEQVVAVLGPTLSSEAFAADPIAQENGTVVMGVSNTATGITDMGDFVFRNSLPESAVIPGVVKAVVAAYGLERVGILYGNDNDFTVSGYEVFVAALESEGVEVVGTETFARGDVAFGAQLTNLAGQDLDAIMVSALAAEAVPILIQARGEAGYEGLIVGGNGFNSLAVLQQAGDAANDLVVGAAWNLGRLNATGAAFAENYTAATEGNAPDQFAAQAYTGAYLLASAIRCADSVDRTAVRDALLALPEVETPLGLFSFDANRNPLHDPVSQIVVDGAFTVLGAE